MFTGTPTICSVRAQIGTFCRGTTAGLGSSNEANCFRKQIALIFMSELFSRDGKRGARHSASEKVNTAKISAIDFVDGSFDYLPLWAILAEGVASIIVISTAAARLKPATSRAVACPPPPAQISRTVSVIPPEIHRCEQESNRLTKPFPRGRRIPSSL